MKTIKVRRFSFRRSIVLALLACAIPAGASAATIHGNTDAAVVWVSAPGAVPQAGDGEMRNRNRTFIPPYIVIPVGGQIRFPNDDPFYHSIYSDSKADPFDIGYYGPGPGKLVTFNNPGVLDVHCHIHATMHANIIVADGPYAVASNGTYALSGVPEGKHTLHAWDPQHGERTMTVNVPSADADVTLDVRR
jgi:plastocyanin